MHPQADAVVVGVAQQARGLDGNGGTLGRRDIAEIAEDAAPAAGGKRAMGRRLDRRPSIRDHLDALRSEEHTSELQSLMRISYAVFCLKKQKAIKIQPS